MFKRKPKYDRLTLFELYSDDLLRYSLESLNYLSSVRGSNEIETIKLASIPNSILTEKIFKILFAEKFRLGDYIYAVEGNRLVRYNPQIRVKEGEKELYKISEPFKVKVDIDKDPGVVLSVK